MRWREPGAVFQLSCWQIPRGNCRLILATPRRRCLASSAFRTGFCRLHRVLGPFLGLRLAGADDRVFFAAGHQTFLLRGLVGRFLRFAECHWSHRPWPGCACTRHGSYPPGRFLSSSSERMRFRSLYLFSQHKLSQRSDIAPGHYLPMDNHRFTACDGSCTSMPSSDRGLAA